MWWKNQGLYNGSFQSDTDHHVTLLDGCVQWTVGEEGWGALTRTWSSTLSTEHN